MPKRHLLRRTGMIELRVMKHAPRAESEITLFDNSFVSTKDAAGDVESLLMSSLSPPTVSWTR